MNDATTTNTPDATPSPTIQLLEQPGETAGAGACGCGSCGCGA
ncbi:hypothetical protein [Cryobacterium psychrophilum]|nr:hypothetical protein [Cryobacterium psychrophilum]TDW31554.1 hypothetical protein EDD25_3373 [Cryobacterium psychrophilum]